MEKQYVIVRKKDGMYLGSYSKKLHIAPARVLLKNAKRYKREQSALKEYARLQGSDNFSEIEVRKIEV